MPADGPWVVRGKDGDVVWAPCSSCPWPRNCTMRRACWQASIEHVLPSCGGPCQWPRACAEDGHCWLFIRADPVAQAWG